jgi:hypothetical protein
MAYVKISCNLTTESHTEVAVAATSTAVLAANPNREYALFMNDSDTVQYLMLGAAAVANKGIRLNASGGSYEMSPNIGNMYRGAIYGIHGGSGNKNLLVLEGK